MTIKQTSPMTWEYEFEGSYCTTENAVIEATAAGLQVGKDVIPWAQIDAARAALGPATGRQSGFSQSTFPQVKPISRYPASE